MLWALIWVVLVLGAACVFYLVGRDLWRKAAALLHEMGDAADRLSEVADGLGEHSAGPLPDVRSQGSTPPQQR